MTMNAKPINQMGLLYQSMVDRYKKHYLAMKPFNLIGWSNEVFIKKRLTQELIINTFSDHLKGNFQRFPIGHDGVIRPRLAFLARELTKFLGRMASLYWQLFTSSGALPAGNKATLVFGLPPHSLATPAAVVESVEYFQEKIPSELFILQRTHATEGTHFICSPDPLLEIWLSNHRGVIKRVKGIGRGWLSHVTFFCDALRDPRALLLQKDYLKKFLVVDMNNLGLVGDVIYTNALLDRQELYWNDIPGRKFSLHLFWNSGNNYGTYFYHDARGVPTHPGFPAFHFMNYDKGWYWDSSQASFFITHMGTHLTDDSTPVLFKKIGARQTSQSLRTTVTLFDVTPSSDAWVKEFGIPYNYYKTQNVKDFIEHCLTSLASKNTEVILKGKKKSTHLNDDAYVVFLEEMQAKFPFFKIVYDNSELIDLVARSTAVISIPFTSPCLLAHHLKVPAAYYDPGGELLDIYPHLKDLAFLSNRTQLDDWIRGLET